MILPIKTTGHNQQGTVHRTLYVGTNRERSCCGAGAGSCRDRKVKVPSPPGTALADAHNPKGPKSQNVKCL